MNEKYMLCKIGNIGRMYLVHQRKYFLGDRMRCVTIWRNAVLSIAHDIFEHHIHVICFEFRNNGGFYKYNQEPTSNNELPKDDD